MKNKIVAFALITMMFITSIGSSKIIASENNLENENNPSERNSLNEEDKSSGNNIQKEKSSDTGIEDKSGISNKNVESRATQSTQVESGSLRNIVSSMWGTAPIIFDNNTGVLTVSAGELKSQLNSSYLDNNNTIAKEMVKKIVLEAGVVAPVDSRYLFSGWSTPFKNLVSIEGELDTSNVINMGNMFYYATNLTSVDVSNWNTSNVIFMETMFMSATNLTSLDVSNWNTSNVTNMGQMFYYAMNLTSLDVSDWNTSNVINMSSMFSQVSNLTSLDVSDWNTSNVTNMSNMFTLMNKLESLDVSNWNTSNVTNMFNMFSQARNLTSLDISNWDTNKVTNMRQMFAHMTNLTSLKISNWNTSNVTNMSDMFVNTTKLSKLTLGNKSIFDSTAGLPSISIGQYSGKWERIDPITPTSVYNSSLEFMNDYDGSVPGTYVWQKASYSITYDLGGGTNDLINPVDYTYGTGVISFADARKDGYTFLGWFDASDAEITNISITDMGNKTLIAKWEANTHTITYDLDGGINALTNPTAYTVGVGVSKLDNPTKEGYTFLGWYIDTNTRVTLTKITSISTTDFGDKLIHAKWEKNGNNSDTNIVSSNKVDDGNKETSMPQTGYNNSVTIKLLVAGFLISGGYLLVRSKKLK